MAEYSTAQQDGRACVVCNHEDGAMRPAGFGPCGQLFAHVSCQDGNQVAAQLDAQAEALRNRAGADYAERPMLTLHHGNAEASFTEHPMEVARRALRAAANLEPDPVIRSSLARAAELLPRRSALERRSTGSAV